MTIHNKPPRAPARALTPAEVADVRWMRAQGVRYKIIMRKYPFSRSTLAHAALGTSTYA